MTWDDHEIFDGWGSLLETSPLDWRLYRAAERTFVEYQHLHTAGTTLDTMPPFTAHTWHDDLGLFILDSRSERDYGGGRVIGVQQWQALDEFLNGSTELGVSTIFGYPAYP